MFQRDRRCRIFARMRIRSVALGALMLLAASARGLAQPAEPPAAAATPAVITAPETLPPYYFSPVKVTGKINGDGNSADVTAEVEVHVTREEGWYDVPLRMGQAVVLGIEYEGPREPIPKEPTDGMDDGLHWLFHGRGAHRLTLQLRVPLRRTLNGTNLQLSLPSVPKLFPTQVSLESSSGPLAVEGGRDNAVRTSQTASGSTLIEATVSSPRLDLTWRPLTERPGTISRAMTSITLSRSGDGMRLHATQNVLADGRITQLFVRMPAGFRLAGGGGVAGPSYVTHTESTEEPGWIQVEVAAPERGELQLEWTLESDFPEEGGLIVVDGFDVRGALRQTGTIGVAPVRGFRIIRHQSRDDDVVQRIDATGVRASEAFLSTAYKFERQPFELTLDFQRRRPETTVRPRAVLTLSEERAELSLDYHATVDAGVVDEVVMDWPGGGAEGWSLQETGPGLSIADATDASSGFPGERQRIQLESPSDTQFRVQLKYVRPLMGRAFQLSLPTIAADRRLPTWLVLRGADAVEASLDAESLGRVDVLTNSAADEWLKEQGYAPTRDQIWRSELSPLQLSGSIEVHPLEIASRSRVRVEDVGSALWRVEQQIDCEVRYGRVSELRLGWPAGFPRPDKGAEATALSAQLADGTPLAPSDGNGGLKLTLPSAMQGQFQVQLRYGLPPPEAGEPCRLPIFALLQSPAASVSVEFPRWGTLSVQPNPAIWRPVPTAMTAAWFSDQAPEAFVASLGSALADLPQRYQIDTAFARVRFDETGRSRVAIDYRLRNAPPTIALDMPQESVGERFYWNGVEATPRLSDSDDSARREVALSDEPQRVDGWLRVDYDNSGGPNFRALGLAAAALPTFPPGVDVAETYVELGLPSERCLLTYPAGLTPLFEWVPGPIFQRLPRGSYLEDRESLLGPAPVGSDSANEAVAEAGNVYAFRTIGGASQLTFRSIGLWMMILLGSGLTLGVAFLLWRVPATRNVLTLLVLAFAVSLAGVFASEAVELLLQPVLLGLLAALAAILTHARTAPHEYLSSDRVPQSRTDHGAPSSHRSGVRLSESAMGTTNVPAVAARDSGGSL